MRYCDIAIIGGGAAGLYAAASIASIGRNVIVIEKNKFCGRKIGLTGKGRCNLTNTKPWNDFSTHIHPNSNFLKPAFFSMSNDSVFHFFEEIGLPLVIERGDRVYPASMRATDVTHVLLDYLQKNNVYVINNFEVKNVIKDESDNFIITDTSNQNQINASKIILATGGLSYPSTGSTGFGYELAKNFGHTIEHCFPSLTALIPDNYSIFSALSNSSNSTIQLKNISVSLLVDGNCVEEEFGDMDFTNGGIEGPVGFKVSRRGVEALHKGAKVEIVLDLKPALSIVQLTDRIKRESATLKGTGNILPIALLKKLIPHSLITVFTNYYSSIYKNIKGLDARTIAMALKSWRFKIVSHVGYERAVITAGGVSLNEIFKNTMESKKVKGLYFAGEVINIDGDTGGYNLQISFSTGHLAAVNAAKSL